MNAKQQFTNNNADAITFLKCHSKKHSQIDSLFLRGSNAYRAEQILNWSDIDATVVVKSASANTLRVLKRIYSEFQDKFPQINLSLTVMETKDTPQTNPIHHHGVKPIAYNFEVAKHTRKNVPFTLTEDALRLSSVYRYYEILHNFRRTCVNNPRFTAKIVAREFHRLAYFLKTQVEILRPELIQKTGKVQVQNHLPMLRPAKQVRNFFRVYNNVRKNWERIQNDDAQIQTYGEYLTDLFNATHSAFLPKLIKQGKRYCK